MRTNRKKPTHKFIGDPKWPDWINNYQSKWPEIKHLKKRAPGMLNTAAIQVMSALLVGDKNYIAETKPNVDWRKVPMDAALCFRAPDSDELVFEEGQVAAVNRLGYNPYKIVETLMSIVKEENGNEIYVCTLQPGRDNMYAVMCPIHLIYKVIHSLVMGGKGYARKRVAKRSAKPTRRKK